jgi:hypothetical protein
MTMMSAAAELHSLNPITYEVIRNRLISMTEDMRVALQSASGSMHRTSSPASTCPMARSRQWDFR